MGLKEASETIFTFGKYTGRSVGEIYAEDFNYLEWFLENIEATNSSRRKCIEAIEAFLNR